LILASQHFPSSPTDEAPVCPRGTSKR
jgi:hypothetical protein